MASAGEKTSYFKFDGKGYLVGRQLKRKARRDIIAHTRRRRHKAHSHDVIFPTACQANCSIYAEASHGCCRVYEDRIPIDYQIAVMAEELGMNLVTAALQRGEL